MICVFQWPVADAHHEFHTLIGIKFESSGLSVDSEYEVRCMRPGTVTFDTSSIHSSIHPSARSFVRPSDESQSGRCTANNALNLFFKQFKFAQNEFGSLFRKPSVLTRASIRASEPGWANERDRLRLCKCVLDNISISQQCTDRFQQWVPETAHSDAFACHLVSDRYYLASKQKCDSINWNDCLVDSCPIRPLGAKWSRVFCYK